MGGERLQSVLWLGFKELASLGRDAAMVGLIIYAFTYAVYGPAKGAQIGRASCRERVSSVV